MTEENEQPIDEVETISLLEKLHLHDANTALWTIVFAILGAVIYVGVSLIPMPFMMVSILKFGLLPAVTIIALTGAIRGPIAGFVAGYLGEILYGLLVYNVVITTTLPAMAYGVLGFVVGLASYDFTNGRSLLKLSILSVVGFVFTILLTVVLAITVEGYSVLAAIAFSMLPLMTMGLLTLLFLTPVLARVWYIVMGRLSTVFEEETAE